MINNDSIKTWEDFKALDLLEQVQTINTLLEQGHSMPLISDSIGANRSTIGAYFKKQGYKRIGDTFVPIGDVLEPVQAKPVSKKQASKNKALEVYSDVHNIMIDIDTDTFVRTSISLAKSTNDKLDIFLKDLKLLKKQDIITVALEQFISKYNK